tara:strand:+ start:592 stop:693 length:102 start_codon:yes stop_codon:yes gene_type:complete
MEQGGGEKVRSESENKRELKRVWKQRGQEGIRI